MKLSTVARYSGAVLLLILVTWTLLRSLPRKQHHLAITHKFGIGFDLSPSYGTVAVSYPNGSIRSIARVEGSEAYREMMSRLSLRSSEHLHQPYENVGDAINDYPRLTLRNVRKRLGLPASRDVGILADMIRALRDEASCFVGEPVSVGAVSIPHLAALYGEDLYDAFEHLSLVWLDILPSWNYNPVYASLAAYAGNGLGLCEEYRNVAECNDEESRMPGRWVLCVSYTHTSLITSQARLSDAYGIQDFPRFESMHLGYDARHGDSYWDAVRNMLRSPVVESSPRRNVAMVLVYGDATEKPEFREALRQVIDDVIDGEPVIVDQLPEFSAARGAAELAKRAIFKPKRDRGTESEL